MRKDIRDTELLRSTFKKAWRGYEIFLVLIMILELFMMIYGLIIFNLKERIRILYFSSYVFLFSFSAVVFIINRFCIKKGNKDLLQINNAIIYNIVLIAWSVLISVLDLSRGGFPITYMTILAAIGSIFIFSPIKFIIMSLISSTGLLLGAIFFGEFSAPVSFYINYFIFILVIIVVEARNYYSIKKEFMLEKKLEELVKIDDLTHIANRRSLDNYIDELIGKEEKFCFVLIDVDNFKVVNDKFGHQEGDLCLEKIAKVLSDIFGNNVFRYGGDEFGIISFEDSNTLIEKIDYTNEQLAKLRENYPLQISAGIFYSNGNNSAQKIFQVADKALYEAKNQGKAKAVAFIE